MDYIIKTVKNFIEKNENPYVNLSKQYLSEKKRVVFSYK